ncbi:MAG: hypothetical protein D6755_04310 [Anaerolineae bacterium]|nr:MAG: hypothetical protein D6755_04310 [Anaerolineae bacterium]
MAVIETSSDSLLALDIGATSTRALFFDLVDGQYRFVAAGQARTTAGAPFYNVMEGARMAIDNLQELIGRRLIGRDEALILPAVSATEGVDNMVLVLSAGKAMRVLVLGLLEDVSVASARRLVESAYARVVDAFTLSDRRSLENRLDAILRLRPDLVMVVGGTEGGARLSVRRLLDPLRLALSLTPQDGAAPPQVFYAGNSALREEIETILGDAAPLTLAPNVRPALESEDFAAAHLAFARVFREHAIRTVGGVEELDAWAGGNTMPAATAQGRMVRFLSLGDTSKGALSLDVGAGSVTLAAAFGGHLFLGTHTDLGLGIPVAGLTRGDPYATLQPWLTANLPAKTVREYVFNRALHPMMIPVSEDEVSLEHTIARYAIHQSVQRLLRDMRERPGDAPPSMHPGVLPEVEPIILTGGVFSNTTKLGRTLLTALDGLQPAGITAVLLDRYNLVTVLGAAASVNPPLTIQTMDSSMLVRLALVVAPISQARLGAPVLRVRLTDRDSGEEITRQVKQGSLEVLPLAPGRRAVLRLQPLYRTNIGLGPGRKAAYEVTGSALGVVIDARGRPLRFHKDMGRREELYRKWLWSLGG